MTSQPVLRLRDDPSKRIRLKSGQSITIGREANNRLAMPSQSSVSDHHAVVRFSRSHGWLICDWQSRDGTYLEGNRIRQCRPLDDGDEIQLGRKGPVLVFEIETTAQLESAIPKKLAHPPRPKQLSTIDIDGEVISLTQIRTTSLRSEARFPNIFSWWLLISVGGLMFLPAPVFFFLLEITAMAGWILLGSRKNHTLVVVFRDGQARRHSFVNRRTALAHRNGIRKAIGQSLTHA